MAQPNIVFIFADQHRHDAMGCAGNELIETPNLDRLAARGVRFSNAWCQSPICQPSRGSLITGRLPHQIDILKNFGPDMDPARPTFMQHLQTAGYRTANVGKTHYYAEGLVEADGEDRDMRRHEPDVRAFGFDHVVEEFDRYVHAADGVVTPYTEYLRREGVFDAYRDQIRAIWRLTEHHWDGVTSPLDQEHDLTSFLTRAAMSWLDDQHDGAPFFLQLSYVQPHVPLMGDPLWADHYAHADIPRGPRAEPVASSDAWDRYLTFCRRHSQAHLLTDDYVLAGARQYYAMISLIDQCVGDLVAHLDRTGRAADTWIVYSSDHGEMLGDHGLMAKFNFYRSSVQVPLLVVPPKGADGFHGLGRTVDDLVEVVDIAPSLLEAAGARPLADAAGQSLLPGVVGDRIGKDAVFSEIELQSSRHQTSRYRALRTARHRLTVETESGTPCELFDLEADPAETHNLVDDAAHRAVRDDLTEQLLARLTPA